MQKQLVGKNHMSDNALKTAKKHMLVLIAKPMAYNYN